MKWKIKKQKDKIYNAWTFTLAQKKSYIINALRQLTRWWKPITRTKANARIKPWIYICANCWIQWKEYSNPPIWKTRRIKNFAVDHKIPIIWKEWFTWYDSWIDRAFIEVWEWLWLLCSKCHKDKTTKENKQRKLYIKNR